MTENAILLGSRLHRQLPIKLQSLEKLMAGGNVFCADPNQPEIRRHLYLQDVVQTKACCLIAFENECLAPLPSTFVLQMF